MSAQGSVTRISGFGPLPATEKLARIIRDEGLPEKILRLDHGDLAELNENALRTYARMVAEEMGRHAGDVPPDETAVMICTHCGPVWTAQSVVEALPVRDGFPLAMGCPWCHLARSSIPVPRPRVACGECRHFIRDSINPFAGSGGCREGVQQDRMYPAALHVCAHFRPKEADMD